MAALQDFRIKVDVIDGPDREELFDSNRLVELNLTREFTFRVRDLSGQLQFLDFLGRPHPIALAKVKLEATIVSCESRSSDGKMWRVKLLIPVRLIEVEKDSTSFFTDFVETSIIYSTTSRHGEPTDRKFVPKFMRYYDRSDENNPNGLWLAGWIARLTETVVA